MNPVLDALLERQAASIPLLPNLQTCASPHLQPQIASTRDTRLRAALYLLNDDIHNCHEIAQARDGDADFDLLHSILHRREGDFWNSCWWIDRLKSPMLMELYGGADLSAARANAKRFVKQVESWSRDGQVAEKEQIELQGIQYHELSTLVRRFSG